MSQLNKTEWVRFVEHGHCAWINAAEYDPKVHERVPHPVLADANPPTGGTASANAPAAAPDGAAPEQHPIVGMNATNAIAFVSGLAAADDVAAATAAESTHPRYPGGRAAVMKALDAARDRVAATPQ